MIRIARWLLALILAICLLGAGSARRRFDVTGEERFLPQVRGMVQWAFRGTRLLPHPAVQASVAYTEQPPFGVNTFLEQEVEPAKRARTLAMIREAGFHWIRQSFPWYDIEIHGKGDFEDRRHEPYRSAWDKYDNIVTLAGQYQLGIIARLEAPPAWSRHDGTARGAFGPPDNFEDYGDYVSAIVSRYRGAIRFYQIWNEPNIYPEWGKQPVDPEAYTRLLCLAYRRVKETDPEAVVISGALAPTAELGTWNAAYNGNNLMDVIFLQRMYNAGAGACFDILAVNDYMLWSGPGDHRMRPTQDQVNFSRPLWVRDVMVVNGDAAKPIWISEMNSNAAPPGIPDRFGRVTPEQQARYAPLAYERIQREWPWVGVATIWFFKRATDAEKDQPMYYFRMVEPDFTPTPLYTSLSAYLNRLTPTLYMGRHQAESWQVNFEGRWEPVTSTQAALGSYRRASGPGDKVTFTWQGHALILHPGPGLGQVLVVEGQRRREFSLHGKAVVLARHLRAVPRQLTLTVLEGTVALDEWQVK